MFCLLVFRGNSKATLTEIYLRSALVPLLIAATEACPKLEKFFVSCMFG